MANNTQILCYNSIAEFKAQYYDAFVDRSLLTNFRDTAKELGMKQNAFITWLLDNNFIYRDKKKRIRPYAEFTHFLFEIKDFKSDVNNYAGEQTLITPKGKIIFKRMLDNFN